MQIDVRRIAKLAMLELPEDQVKTLEQEFAAFLSMARRLPEAESEDLHILPEEPMLLREDIVTPSYPREAMLQNAPQTAMGYFVAPKALEAAETGVTAI